MKNILMFLIVIFSAFGTACDNVMIENAGDFEFETFDKDDNKVKLSIMVRYRLKTRLQKKASQKHGRYYKDSLLLPVISSISETTIKNYSAGEIYYYKREEIEQKLSEQAKTKFAEGDLELTNFVIKSVGLSETLMLALEKEHITRFERSMNSCKRETKGVIAEIKDMGSYDDLIMYEFFIANKRYFGYLNTEEAKRRDKVIPGDSLVIEYACEDPIFHKVKR